jgi:hypothetical protein
VLEKHGLTKKQRLARSLLRAGGYYCEANCHAVDGLSKRRIDTKRVEREWWDQRHVRYWGDVVLARTAVF